MPHLIMRTVLLTLFVLVSAMGVTSVLANTTLKANYQEVLHYSSPLIKHSLLSADLSQKLNDANPIKTDWATNTFAYFQKDQNLQQLKKTIQQTFQDQRTAVTQDLQKKLESADVYVKENPKTSAEPMLLNTIDTVKKQLNTTNTSFEDLLNSQQLLSENNEYFKSVALFEKKGRLLQIAEDLTKKSQELIPVSQQSNNVALTEIQAIIHESTALSSIADIPTIESKLKDLQTRLTSSQQALAEEKARIEKEEAERKAEEERLAKLEAERLAEEKRKAEEFAKTQPHTSYKHVLIDISDQIMYRFEGNNVIDSTAVVTGRPGFDTVRGTFSVISKARNITLTSPFPGITYNYPVNYWVGFTNQGHGIHDAYHRSEFGGTIYTWNGSHGCVNTPFNYVQNLYNWISYGDTVQVID